MFTTIYSVVHYSQCRSVWTLLCVFLHLWCLITILPSQRKIPAVPVISLCWHYLLRVSADAWQNDIPDSSAALPDNSRARLIKKKIANHILLMPLAVTPAIFLPRSRSVAVQIPAAVQRTGGKKAKEMCFISLVERVNAQEASKLKPHRSNMRGAPA